MSEPKRALRALPETVPQSVAESLPEARDRSPTVIAFGLVAVISMLFGFVIGLLF